MRVRSLLVCGAAALVLLGMLVPAAVGAGPLVVQSLSQVSRTPSLPASCLNPSDGAPSFDTEPDVAVDPGDPGHIAVAWAVVAPQVYFAFKAVEIAISHDGGVTWRRSIQRGVDSCSGNPQYSKAGAHDQTLSFGPDGRLYLSSISAAPGPNGAVEEAQWVSVSDEGGSSWRDPVGMMQASPTFGRVDQTRITADPRRSGVAYLMAQVCGPGSAEQGCLDSGNAYFSRSGDAGRTWSAPVVAYTPAGTALRAPYSNHVHVLADGTLLDVFTESNGSASLPPPSTAFYPYRIYAIRSSDAGNTWSVPVPISGEIAEHSSAENVNDPEGRGPAWLAVPKDVPSALAPDGKTAYVMWEDASVSGPPRSTIHIARSSDGGLSWTQVGPVTGSTTAFMPTVAVAGDGTVGATWYDMRNDKLGDAPWTLDVYFASSTDRGAHWTERHLAGPMDLRSVKPFRIIGDYFGLAGLPDGFGAAFTLAKPLATDGPTDIFYAHIGFAGSHHHSANPITLPSATNCIRRRRLVIRLRRPAGTRILRATIYVNGRRVLQRSRLNGRVVLRGLPRETFTVRVVLRLRTPRGVRTISVRRRYRPCVA